MKTANDSSEKLVNDLGDLYVTYSKKPAATHFIICTWLEKWPYNDGSSSPKLSSPEAERLDSAAEMVGCVEPLELWQAGNLILVESSADADFHSSRAAGAPDPC